MFPCTSTRLLHLAKKGEKMIMVLSSLHRGRGVRLLPCTLHPDLLCRLHETPRTALPPGILVNLIIRFQNSSAELVLTVAVDG